MLDIGIHMKGNITQEDYINIMFARQETAQDVLNRINSLLVKGAELKLADIDGLFDKIKIKNKSINLKTIGLLTKHNGDEKNENSWSLIGSIREKEKSEEKTIAIFSAKDENSNVIVGEWWKIYDYEKTKVIGCVKPRLIDLNDPYICSLTDNADGIGILYFFGYYIYNNGQQEPSEDEVVDKHDYFLIFEDLKIGKWFACFLRT
jgi:hypothetical protein